MFNSSALIGYRLQIIQKLLFKLCNVNYLHVGKDGQDGILVYLLFAVPFNLVTLGNYSIRKYKIK